MRTRDNTILMGLLLAAGAASTPALAVNVLPSSYAMVNGGGQASGGSLNYWDAGYSGTGNPTIDGAVLSGGLGKLTDGVIATQRWDVVSNVAGSGQYVGWYATTQPNPVITFSFAGSPTIQQIDIYLDNSGYGGVFAPVSILVDGSARAFTPTVGDAIHLTFSGLTLTGNSHSVQFVQGGGQWTFVSEIAFSNALPVPEAGTLGMAFSGVALVAALARRRLPAARRTAP